MFSGMLLIVWCDHTQSLHSLSTRLQSSLLIINHLIGTHQAPLSPCFGQNNQTDNFPLDMDRWWEKPSPVRDRFHLCLDLVPHTRKQSRGRHLNLLLQLLTSRAPISALGRLDHVIPDTLLANLHVRETDVWLLSCNTQERAQQGTGAMRTWFMNISWIPGLF